MDLLTQATAGFQSIDADAALKEQALKYLKQWLGGSEFAGYRPQLVHAHDWQAAPVLRACSKGDDDSRRAA